MTDDHIYIDAGEDLQTILRPYPRLVVEAPVSLRIDDMYGPLRSREQRLVEQQAYNDLKASVADATPAEAFALLQTYLSGLSVDSPYYRRVEARLRLAEHALDREQRRAVREEQHVMRRLAARSPIQRATLELQIQSDQLRWEAHQHLLDTRIQGEELRLSLLDTQEPFERRYDMGDRLSFIEQPVRLSRSPPDVLTPIARHAQQTHVAPLISKEQVAAKASKVQHTAGAMLKLALVHAYKQAVVYTGVRNVHH